MVSARAIKHVRNLAQIAETNNTEKEETVQSVILFVINRSDCMQMRTCSEACSKFAEEVKVAVDKGVIVTSFRVRWTTEGKAFFDGMVPVSV